MYMIVNPRGESIPVQRGGRVLRALLGAKIPIPYSCEDGRCGMCRYELVSGTVVECGSPPWQFPGMDLSYKLACQSTLVDNCIIKLPDPEHVVVHRQRRFSARVLAKERLSERIMSLTISSTDGFTFSPGQFSELRVAPGMKRTYSIADTGQEGTLTFHLQRHPYGRASGYIWESLPIGGEVQVSGPLGVSYLRTPDECPILCVSSESGLGPVLSILRGISRIGMQNPVYVYVGFMRKEDVYMVDEVERLAGSIPGIGKVQWVVYSVPGRGNGRSQTLSSAIAEDFSDLSQFRTYIFGSPCAIEPVVRLARKLGVPKERLHADAFTISDD